MADVLALCSASLECGKEGFGDFFISRLGEEQCDIDVDAFFESLADRGEPFGRAGNLDHDVRAIHGLPQAPSFGERGFGVETKKRRDFQAHVTVSTLRLRIDRSEDVASILNVTKRDFFEEAVGVEFLRVRRHEDIVVEIAAGDGLFEDGRVGSQ